MTRSLAVALLALLLIVGQASAECAWVLWSYTIDKIELYQVQSAHASKAECGTETTGFRVVLKSAGYKVKAGRAGVLGRKGSELTRYFCLPDTVDPRGLKGNK